MAKFQVIDIFAVSFRPEPFVLGRVEGNFSVGQSVVLKKPDGRKFYGTIKSVEFHQPAPDQFSSVFSEDVSNNVEAGDLIVPAEGE
ncbi:hypothetical protein GCM10011591_26520 [Nocardia camponoti]|uniref:Uncharacterized protein n=2 Tax=Nocardia camponoti TaxID=1616106 RepID=A0A917QKB4_9NOCA|nr:hypothetical protein GCM10011591_26520 [Nocardia camponoti]